MDNELAWLEAWYEAQCDEAWEHTYGIRIDTLDNPGWSIRIDLHGTSLEGDVMPRFVRDAGNEDWMFCEIKDKTFEGHGDPRKLGAILRLFRDWVLQHQDQAQSFMAYPRNEQG